MAFARSDHDGLPREGGVIDVELITGTTHATKRRQRLGRS